MNQAKLTFGERLADLRYAKGLKQDELAEAIGLTKSQIANYETNRNSPDKEKLILLADFFNVPIDFLVCRIDNMIDYTVYDKEIHKGITRSALLNRIENLSEKSIDDLIEYLDLLLLREGSNT